MVCTADLIQSVSDRGFCKIPSAFEEGEIQKALSLVREWQDNMRGREAASVPYLNQDQAMVYNLQNKAVEFLQMLFANSTGQEVLRHFLNDPWYKEIPQDQANYILRSFLARSSNDALPMHIDSFTPYGGEHVTIMQYAIVLEPMDESRGCTVVVPGSHKSESFVAQRDREKAIPVIAEPGDILIWDSRLWHGTTANKTPLTRWVLIATFSRWWIKQAFNITQALPENIYHSLTPEQKAILGFCSTPHLDETEGIDMKRGYNELREKSIMRSA